MNDVVIMHERHALVGISDEPKNLFGKEQKQRTFFPALRIQLFNPALVAYAVLLFLLFV